jgi:hypothetical protein
MLEDELPTPARRSRRVCVARMRTRITLSSHARATRVTNMNISRCVHVLHALQRCARRNLLPLLTL